MTADRSPPPVDGRPICRRRGATGNSTAFWPPPGYRFPKRKRAELRRAYDAICDLAARVRRPDRQWTAKPFFAARKES